MNMNRAPRATNQVYQIRPAGLSDSDESEDDDYYSITGFSTSRRRAKYVAVSNENGSSSNQPPDECNGNASGQDRTGGEENHEDDWEVEDLVAESWGRSPSEAVRLACLRGNLEKLKQLFSNGSSPGVNQVFGGTEETPLITSCKAGHHELVKYLLLEKSANPNTRDPAAKITPLMAACAGEAEEEQLLECVQALLEGGANLDMQNRYGHTALGIAIRQNRNLLASYLIENKADANIIDPDSQSVLFYAAMDGNGKICRLLLENGADIQIVDKNGWTAPDLAQDKGFDRLSDLLYIARDSKWKPGMNPELMQQLDDEAIRARREAVDSQSLREDSLIELLLSSIEATKYFENFRKHRISYVQFLNLDDNQLREIGIAEVGVREKILDSTKRIHSVNWQNSSLETTALCTNKKVTAAETVCMIVSIRDHLKYISATLQCIKSRITAYPLALQYDAERNKLGTIKKLCEETETNCNLVRQDAVGIHEIIDGLSGYTELQIAGQIPKRNFQQTEKPGKFILKFGIGTGLLVMSLLLFRKFKLK